MANIKTFALVALIAWSVCQPGAAHAQAKPDTTPSPVPSQTPMSPPLEWKYPAFNDEVNARYVLSILDTRRDEIIHEASPTAWDALGDEEKHNANREQRSCLVTYRDFYSAPTIEIRVSFGYGDSTPDDYVNDFAAWVAFTRHLTARCPDGYSACGFVADASDKYSFHKLIPVLGGERRMVHLRMVHSSITASDFKNRRSMLTGKQATAAARNFSDGLTNGAQAVFYLGHSRDGGGPDFLPPMTTEDEKHVDYPAYQRMKLGVQKIIDGFSAGTGPKPMLVGLMSCSSSPHFDQTLLKSAPKVGFVGTRYTTLFTNVDRMLVGTLDSLLSMKCAAGFDAAIANVETGKPNAIMRSFFK